MNSRRMKAVMVKWILNPVQQNGVALNPFQMERHGNENEDGQ